MRTRRLSKEVDEVKDVMAYVSDASLADLARHLAHYMPLASLHFNHVHKVLFYYNQHLGRGKRVRGYSFNVLLSTKKKVVDFSCKMIC
jgi:hypothetical protein